MSEPQLSIVIPSCVGPPFITRCLVNWAVYCCDFGRYQGPLPPGAADFVSDSNVAYKRRALDAVRELWSERRHLSRLLAAFPLIVVLETVWSIGEFVGYSTGRTPAAQRGHGHPMP